MLLKNLRVIRTYEEAMKTLSSKHLNLFIRFINMILNDSHFLLDEVLEKLPSIRETELEMKDTATWMSQNQVIDPNLSFFLYFFFLYIF